jgi:uncharacterized protein HemX
VKTTALGSSWNTPAMGARSPAENRSDSPPRVTVRQAVSKNAGDLTVQVLIATLVLALGVGSIFYQAIKIRHQITHLQTSVIAGQAERAEIHEEIQAAKDK